MTFDDPTDFLWKFVWTLVFRGIQACLEGLREWCANMLSMICCDELSISIDSVMLCVAGFLWNVIWPSSWWLFYEIWWFTNFLWEIVWTWVFRGIQACLEGLREWCANMISTICCDELSISIDSVMLCVAGFLWNVIWPSSWWLFYEIWWFTNFLWEIVWTWVFRGIQACLEGLREWCANMISMICCDELSISIDSVMLCVAGFLWNVIWPSSWWLFYEIWWFTNFLWEIVWTWVFRGIQACLEGLREWCANMISTICCDELSISIDSVMLCVAGFLWNGIWPSSWWLFYEIWWFTNFLWEIVWTWVFRRIQACLEGVREWCVNMLSTICCDELSISIDSVMLCVAGFPWNVISPSSWWLLLWNLMILLTFHGKLCELEYSGGFRHVWRGAWMVCEHAFHDMLWWTKYFYWFHYAVHGWICMKCHMTLFVMVVFMKFDDITNCLWKFMWTRVFRGIQACLEGGREWCANMISLICCDELSISIDSVILCVAGFLWNVIWASSWWLFSWRLMIF
jgi:hypothetical protein